MAEVVFSGISGGSDLQGTLFQGQKFWLSQKVPQRSRFIEDVKANGGEVLPLEKHADIKIVDHRRNEALPGTYSYTYIDKSIRNGTLENLEDHAVGPPAGTVRSAGSVIQPAKATRTKFTQEDDRELWLWVEKTPQQGGGTDGNEIYKQLEEKNPRHTWQSWRDRWVKYLKKTPGPAFVPTNAPPTPPSDQPTTEDPTQLQVKAQETQGNKLFSEEDANTLLDMGEDILNIYPHPENIEDAWEKWAQEHDPGVHSAQEWKEFWTNSILPLYMKRKAKRSEKDAESEPAASKAEAQLVLERSRSPSKRVFKVVPVERNPSYEPESPSVHTTNASVPAERMPLSRTQEPETGIPAVDLPQSQITGMQELDLEFQNHKRKRAFFDEEEFPNSSPPEVFSLSKRQHRPNVQEQPIEIASTPERSPALNAARSPIGDEPNDHLDLDDVTTPERHFNDEDDLEDIDTHFGRPPSQSLSSPGRTAYTQAVFQDPTQYINLDLASPEDGWSDDDEDENSTASSPPLPTHPPEPINPDTQTLLESKTQVPTFSIPSPDIGWEESLFLPSSPPAHDPSPHSASPAPAPAEITAHLDAWIDACIADGHAADNIQLALKCTCMDAHLAETVLESLQQGDGVPEGVRGVWTERDDEALEGTDARAVEAVGKKHGAEGVGLRWEFLRVWRGGVMV